MRGSIKTLPPQEFVEWLSSYPEATYVDLGGDPKKALRNQLIEEQRGVCVYCGRRAGETRQPMGHIEHFRPSSKYPEAQLEYTNLFFSCGDKEPDHLTTDHCGAWKGAEDLPNDYINPQSEGLGGRFSFTETGEILGTDSASKAMIDFLNLNQRNLKALRAQLIQGLTALILEGDIKSLAAFWDEIDENGREKSLSYVARNYILSLGNTVG